MVEMLIAMAITLLMMAALAKSFGFIGQRVRDGRAAVTLSGELRDITTRLNDELSQCTVPLRPATADYEPPGYFLYVEGPMTSTSSLIFGSSETIDEQERVLASRYGDLDDFLAFTAVAKPGQWFQGRVPRFVLTGVPADTDPVSISSKYAEIVYFNAPDRAADGTIIDVDADGLPDRVNLCRRVLLIRPDLNLIDGRMHRYNLSSAGGAAPPWDTALALVHQQCDLSVRRSRNTNGGVANRVVANTLVDLAQPHCRFAHVQVPDNVLGGVDNASSMPIVALTEPVPMLRNAPSGFRPGTSQGDPTAGGSTQSIVLESRFSGFLNPSYVLAGDRQGEDVIANNCRGLDVQIQDRESRSFLMTGDTNLIVTPSDPAYREALRDPAATVIPGGFVDLCYPLLAGGATRGWREVRLTVSEPEISPHLGSNPAVDVDLLKSPFSGINPELGSYLGTANRRVFSQGLLRSGRVVITGNAIRLFQPAFDTYTYTYEVDGYRQNNRLVQGVQSAGTVWNSSSNDADLGANGLDEQLSGPGADDISERETLPPFSETPNAIRVSVRLEHLGNRQLRQQSVVFTGK